MKLQRGLPLRIAIVAIAAGLIGASTTLLGSVLFHRQVMRLVMTRVWQGRHDRVRVRRCPQDPSSWSVADAGGVRIDAYDARTGRSANPTSPPLEPELRTARREEGPTTMEFFLGKPWGGAVAFREGDAGPCSLVVARWPPSPKLRSTLPLLVGSSLVATVLATLGLVAWFIVRPLRRRVASLLAAAQTVGSEAGYAPPSATSHDFLGALALRIDDAHRRIREDAEALLSHREAMERFVADVAHDLRTPITSLQLALEELDDAVLPDEQRRRVRGALNDTVYMASLTENLRLATKLRDGWEPMAGNPRADLTAIVQHVTARQTHFARRRAVQVDAAYPDEPLWVPSDPTLLEQAVSNVVENAVAHGHEGGHVGIELQRGRDRFALRIMDDGPGVPPSDLPRLGARTFRTDEARQRDPKGSGLGLAIALEVCERSGFELTFEPNEPRGLCVVITGRRLAQPPE